MSANVYADLAELYGVTPTYVTDLARQGRLHELTEAGDGTRTAGTPAGRSEDVEQSIYEHAKRLEQVRQRMSGGERAKADLEARMQRILREEVYDVARGPAVDVLRYQRGSFFEEWHCEPPQDPAQGYQVLQDRWVQEPNGANVRQILRIELAESEPVSAGMLGAAASIEARSRRESP